MTSSLHRSIRAVLLSAIAFLTCASGAAPGDRDDDGVLDAVDNCSVTSNPTQRDSDQDGYGNHCDGDLNNDGIVNIADLGEMRLAFFQNGDLAADLNGDEMVNVVDLGIFRTLFFSAPGPSALAPVPPGIGALIDDLEALPEGEWYLANNNLFSDVWTPAELRPLKNGSNPAPDRIIEAWSGFAWDKNRAQIILYGGGHSTYSGNDVYVFKAVTGLWERAALPSEIVRNSLGEWESIDGVDAAPGSAHTYDNAIFLPQFDRYLNFGGAQWNSGGSYFRANEDGTFTLTGPYFFDPSRANGDMVGGTTGSHVQREGPFPEITGGEMWVNRDMYANATFSGGAMPASFVNSANAYTTEDGNEVVYVGARRFGSTSPNVFKLTMPSLEDPTLDTVEFVGLFGSSSSGRGAAAYDPQRKIFVRTGLSTMPFAYWNMNTPGPGNQDVIVFPIDLDGDFIMSSDFGIDFDPIRRHFVIWDGGPNVRILKAPDPLGADGWTIERAPAPLLAAPAGPVDNGVLGKWEYASNLDVFVGLRDPQAGSVWFYKPVGWQAPPRGGTATR